MDRAPLLALLQLSDTAFPTGGFAHSGGIESLAASGLIGGAEDLEDVLRATCQLVLEPGDLWFVRRCFEAMTTEDLETVRAVARSEIVSRPAATQRRSCETVGRSFLRTAEAAMRNEPAGTKLVLLRNALAGTYGRASIFGAVSAVMGIGKEDAAGAYLYASVAGHVSAGVRLGLVAALEGQALTRRVLTAPAPLEAPLDSWSTFCPLLDIASMKHAQEPVRFFAS